MWWKIKTKEAITMTKIDQKTVITIYGVAAASNAAIGEDDFMAMCGGLS